MNLQITRDSIVAFYGQFYPFVRKMVGARSHMKPISRHVTQEVSGLLTNFWSLGTNKWHLARSVILFIPWR